MSTNHRKQIKHYHEPGDLHEFTFSCYRRMPLLTNDDWRAALSRSLTTALQDFQIQLVAFVYMPEHVHLLTLPLDEKPNLPGFLARIKQPYSSEIHRKLAATQSRLLEKLIVQERPGKFTFRYWQEGPGYDRNLNTIPAIRGSIDYIHHNPVARKLCVRAIDWKWSSARFYLQPDYITDPDLPPIEPLPIEFWDNVAADVGHHSRE